MCSSDLIFSENQKNILLNIAHQCPLAGGRAVYFARALYRLANPLESYSDRDVCTQLGLFRKSHPGSTSALFSFMYPSPSNKDVTLVYSMFKGNELQLNIFSTTMKLVKQVVLSNKENQKEINIESLNSGLYLYNIVQDKQVVSTGKFNVLH